MKKFATQTATSEYFKNHRLNQTKIRRLDDLTVSALAVGTYLGEHTSTADRQYEAALIFAAKNGVNFFDTAVNYRCQRSERNIAYVLRRLAAEGIGRDQLVVATKGGFLPADGTPETFKNYILTCYLNTGIIKPEDIVKNCHCMTPGFLKSQINLSLANLKVDAIDVYYLHNPEIQLPVVGEDEFYRRVRAAFGLFEESVAAGKIKRYGVATWNGFCRPLGAPDRLDLKRLLECAREVAGQRHHFRVIQLPYNLAMLEAVGIPSQNLGKGKMPIIAAAADAGLAVCISAPLMQSHVARLPDAFYDKMPGPGTPRQKALQFVVSSPGVISAMVGMKQTAHVRENLEVLGMDNWEVADLQKVAKLLVK